MVAGDDRWHEVFERDRGQCRYCGFDLLESFERYYMAEVDHLLPREFPDRDELQHLVLACRACNSRLSRAHGLKLVTFEQRLEYLRHPDLSRPTRDKYEHYVRRRSDVWTGESVAPGARTSTNSAVTRASWKTLPRPSITASLDFEAEYSIADAACLIRGHVPTEMEDRWFSYVENGWLNLHRSWTGAHIFALRLEESAGRVKVVESWVNRDKSQYSNEDLEVDRNMVRSILEYAIQGARENP